MTNEERKNFINNLELGEKELALYVHIPFCERKCNYCSFVSFCDKQNEFDSYIDCLVKELELRKLNNYRLKSIYIGGGTPSLLSTAQITKLMQAIKETYKINNDAEITIEVNPNSVTEEKLLCYKNMGINRLSIGVQSLSNSKLKLLGRLHSSQMAIEAIKLAKKCGFDNISVDLIINLPKECGVAVKKQIRTLKTHINHISVYSLSVEENTPFYTMYQDGKLKLPNEKKCAKIYNLVVKTLKKYGFNRYEVSNFALDGYESKHNLTYWDMGEYLGIGVASHSFINNIRLANTEDFAEYTNLITGNKVAFSTIELTKEQLMEETIMLSLRESKGLNIELFKQKFGVDLLSHKRKELALLKKLGVVKIDNGNIMATDKGFLVLNQIILKLVD